MARTTVLRDSVWGDVDLGSRELSLIDTAAFQRLRRVRQLGFTDLVFPGAHHTRFEHALGVAHVAGTALARLEEVPGAPALADADVRTFRAAALLHDVGHYPFSHAVEELEVEQVRDHERLAAERIRSAPIAGILEREWNVEPARVAWLVAGGDDPAEPTAGLRLLRSLLDSGLDVDKLDYLVRDARAANVPYGLVDVQRLLSCLAVTREHGGPPRLAIDVKGVAALQSLVFAKYLMFASVYWHHACRAAVVMLLRALQEALAAG
ncbi:MAG: HD domain-containing protein, partial [bacterium]|nr:HD domain-containing protein [bacterium]